MILSPEECVIERLRKNRWIPFFENWDEVLCREFADYIDFYTIRLEDRAWFTEDFEREMMWRRNEHRN